MMMVHLVAIDLDGTLLSSSKQISEPTCQALGRLRAETQVEVVLASARPPRTILPFYNQLGLTTPLISYNGAMISLPPERRMLVHKPIDQAAARKIITIARTLHEGIFVSVEILDRKYTDRVSQTYMTETDRVTGPDVVAPIDDFLEGPITKLLLLGPRDDLTGIRKAISTHMPHQVHMLQTEGNLLQIMHSTVSKAQALREVAGQLQVRQEHVMAIGDNANDVEMFQWAGLAVAMGNASSQAIAAADHVCSDNDSDGVADALCRFVLDQ